MDPIERYLADIAAKLPRHKRQNVLDELRRNLNDRVAQLIRQNLTADAAAARAVAELGDPNKLAAEYGGGRVIIPAERYHIFKGAAIYLVAIHLAATVFTTVMDIDVSFILLRAPNLRGLPVHDVVWMLGTQVLADIGLLTLLFWWADVSLPRQFTGWAVRSRTAEAKPHWSGLAGPLVLLGLFNVFRDDVFALYTSGATGWNRIPIFDPAFVHSYMWPVNSVLMLALGTHTYKLISGPTAPTAAVELVYRLAVFALTGALLSVSSPFRLPPGQLQVLEALFAGLFKLALLGALFGNAFALYRAVVRLANRLK